MGEADDYYNSGGGAGGAGQGYDTSKGNYQMQPPTQGYAGPPHQQYAPQQYAPAQHMPPPPTYNANYGGGGGDTKPSFEQTFKVEKPKWNDLWATAALLAVAAGVVAISVLTISKYSSTYGFQGGGIYGSSNDFGLTTNTIVLFGFCLLVAFVLGFAYVWLARQFTKAFIWVTGILNILL